MSLPLRVRKGVTGKESRRNGVEERSLVKMNEVEEEQEEEATSVEAMDTTMAAIFGCVSLYVFIMSPQCDYTVKALMSGPNNMLR